MYVYLTTFCDSWLIRTALQHALLLAVVYAHFLRAATYVVLTYFRYVPWLDVDGWTRFIGF